MRSVCVSVTESQHVKMATFDIIMNDKATFVCEVTPYFHS